MENFPQLALLDSALAGYPISYRASIILVGYNSRDDLERCLPGVLASAAPDVEIILVDNASQDGTAEQIQAQFPEVQVIRSPANLGFGGANNLASRQARGEFLAFLNPDTVVEPGWLEALVAALESDPSAGLATSKILLLDDLGRINTCGNDMHISGLTLCRGMGQPEGAFPALEEVPAVSGAAFAIRKSLFDSLGGFDERFFMYMEDTDLSLRARLAGCACLYVPSSVVYHDYRLAFGSLKTYYQERNRYSMLLKCLRWRTLLALLPVLFLTEVVTWGFVLARDRRNWRNKLRAYAWILHERGEIMLERAKIQRARRVPDGAILRLTNYRLGFDQTGEGPAARAAALVFNPLYLVLHRAILALLKD